MQGKESRGKLGSRGSIQNKLKLYEITFLVLATRSRRKLTKIPLLLLLLLLLLLMSIMMLRIVIVVECHSIIARLDTLFLERTGGNIASLYAITHLTLKCCSRRLQLLPQVPDLTIQIGVRCQLNTLDPLQTLLKAASAESLRPAPSEL